MFGISVVIPTYNAQDLLEKTLDSLCYQHLDKSCYELIVVDDGSSDGTAALVQRYEDRVNIHYHFQDDLGFRVAKARNEGVRRARFENILLFDAGMIASPDLLDIHLRHHRQHHDLAIVGLSYGVNEFTTEYAELLTNAFDSQNVEHAFKTLSLHPELYDCRFPFLSSLNFELDVIAAPWVIFWTGHVSFKKASFDQVGGFDEWFQSWGGEDVELGIRLHQKGCRFHLLDSIESVHYPHPKDPEQKKHNARHNILYICSKHPSPITEMLKHYGWEDIARQHISTNNNAEYAAN